MPRYHIYANGDGAEVDGWKPVNVKPATSPDPARTHLDGLRAQLGLVLSADYVMVLAGLGTSLEIPAVPPTPGGGNGPPAAGRRSRFPTMAHLWSGVQAATGPDFPKVRTGVNYSEEQDTNIEVLLSRCQMARELRQRPGGIDPDGFLRKAEEIIVKECSPVPSPGDLSNHTAVLRRLVRRPARSARAELFTTNYDRCFELAAAEAGLTLIDGFSFALPRTFLPSGFDLDVVTRTEHAEQPDYPPGVLRFFKLHGSIDWAREPTGRVSQIATPDRPLIIYPAATKFQLSYTQPFLEMVSRFQSGLRRRNVGVLVLCSGFNDEHVSGPIMSAVLANPTLRLVVTAPDLSNAGADALRNTTGGKGTCETNAQLKELSRLASSADEQVTLVNGKLSDLVSILPQLPLTDAERRENDRVSTAPTGATGVVA